MRPPPTHTHTHRHTRSRSRSNSHCGRPPGGAGCAYVQWGRTDDQPHGNTGRPWSASLIKSRSRNHHNTVTQSQWISNNKGDGWFEVSAEKCAAVTEKYGVRCCSDGGKGGWYRKYCSATGKQNWHETDGPGCVAKNWKRPRPPSARAPKKKTRARRTTPAGRRGCPPICATGPGARLAGRERSTGRCTFT